MKFKKFDGMLIVKSTYYFQFAQDFVKKSWLTEGEIQRQILIFNQDRNVK